MAFYDLNTKQIDLKTTLLYSIIDQLLDVKLFCRYK